MPYEVINLDTDQSHGVCATLNAARWIVREHELRAYEIWRGHYERGTLGIGDEFITEDRVECCEPYDGDDDRVKQGLGQWNASEIGG